MAYADFAFYRDVYHGNVVPDEDFQMIADRASDFLDRITFERLMDGLPDGERTQTKIKKAVCAVSDRLYKLELAERQALAAATDSASTTTESGTSSGVITSRSAGSQSISYATPSQMASGAKEWSAVYAAAGDNKAMYRILYGAASLYLMGVKDNNGVCLLYAGL